MACRAFARDKFEKISEIEYIEFESDELEKIFEIEEKEEEHFYDVIVKNLHVNIKNLNCYKLIRLVNFFNKCKKQTVERKEVIKYITSNYKYTDVNIIKMAPTYFQCHNLSYLKEIIPNNKTNKQNVRETLVKSLFENFND